MINLPLDQLISKVDSRYTLVVAAAKRAREIMAEERSRQDDKSMKAVSIALEEIRSGRVTCVQTKSGK